mmetsp:Transcript_20955/g.49627  ORF Transcript_20955/g.49627 Transcript_20955/m.49627 type:complete len:221 (-) Transcript_20955:36-698(-)
MVYGQLEADRVQDDPFQQENPFLELEEFFSLGVEVGRRRRVVLGGRSRLLGQPPSVHRPRLEPEALLDDRVELLRRLLGLGGQHQRRHGDLESIVLLEGVLGVEPVKEDHGGRYGHPRELQDATGLLDEPAGLPALDAFLLGRHPLLDGGKLADVEVGASGAGRGRGGNGGHGSSRFVSFPFVSFRFVFSLLRFFLFDVPCFRRVLCRRGLRRSKPCFRR